MKANNLSNANLIIFENGNVLEASDSLHHQRVLCVTWGATWRRHLTWSLFRWPVETWQTFDFCLWFLGAKRQSSICCLTWWLPTWLNCSLVVVSVAVAYLTWPSYRHHLVSTRSKWCHQAGDRWWGTEQWPRQWRRVLRQLPLKMNAEWWMKIIFRK